MGPANPEKSSPDADPLFQGGIDQGVCTSVIQVNLFLMAGGGGSFWEVLSQKLLSLLFFLGGGVVWGGITEVDSVSHSPALFGSDGDLFQRELALKATPSGRLRVKKEAKEMMQKLGPPARCPFSHVSFLVSRFPC